MLVYGDHREVADSRDLVRDINARLDRLNRMPPGIERHAALAAAVIEGGQLLQGAADAAFEDEQCDRRTRVTDRLAETLTNLARALCRSWDSGFVEVGELPRFEAVGMPRTVEVRVPEGFAYYSVYPEAYAEAARRLELSGTPRVIGIRSIGTTLAAVVAAVLGTPPPVTVRPFGDPSARKIAVEPALERELLDGDTHYIIVDEGPGRSGSSFSSAADWLHERGIPHERIAVIASHAGPPGAAASQRRLDWWHEVQRQVGDFGELWPAMTERWCTSLLGPLDAAPQDISAGGWRTLHFESEVDWPAVAPGFERRKFLLRQRGQPFLAKFAGLGGIGERKLAVARALHSEALIPEPIGLVHGFLIERWCDDAVPLGASESPIDQIARYIGMRARVLPAARQSGASIQELLTMARRNISLEFGNELLAALEPWERRAENLESGTVRICTDNKLDRHEWLRTGSGALIKTDALDHHQAHDLIGCQDLVWDVAGALTEFDLDQSEAGELIDSVERWAARAVDPELLQFDRLAYLAFRLGQSRISLSTIGEPREQERIARRGDFYAAKLQHLLESTGAGIRPESLVG